MARRRFLAQMAAWPLAALIPITTFQERRGASLKIVLKSAWGSDDPTKAAFPFSHAHALSEAGHEVRIFLLGEAVGLMRRSVAEAVVPVGWPPVGELLGKVAARKIPILPAGPVHARAEWWRPTSPIGAPSTATRRSSSRW